MERVVRKKKFTISCALRTRLRTSTTELEGMNSSDTYPVSRRSLRSREPQESSGCPSPQSISACFPCLLGLSPRLTHCNLYPQLYPSVSFLPKRVDIDGEISRGVRVRWRPEMFACCGCCLLLTVCWFSFLFFSRRMPRALRGRRTPGSNSFIE